MRVGFLAFTVITLAGCWSTSSESRLDNAGHNAMAMIEIDSGHPAMGIDILERAIDKNPNYAPHYLALAAAWSHYQHGEMVVANLRKFLDLEPNHHQARLYLAEVLYDQNKIEEARNHFEAFLACAVTDDARTHKHRRHSASRLADFAKKSNDPFAAAYFAALRDYEAALVLVRPTDAAQSVSERSLKEASQKLASAMDELQKAKQVTDSPDMVDGATKLAAEALRGIDAGQPVTFSPWPVSVKCPCSSPDAVAIHDEAPQVEMMLAH